MLNTIANELNIMLRDKESKKEELSSTFTQLKVDSNFYTYLRTYVTVIL